jgi:hypothetical protein
MLFSGDIRWALDNSAQQLADTSRTHARVQPNRQPSEGSQARDRASRRMPFLPVVCALLRYTGQRGSDVHRMTRAGIVGDTIGVTQQTTALLRVC